MDKKILAIIAVAIVAVAGCATAFVVMNDDGKDKDGNSEYESLALTNNMFPGHTCCVVAGNQKFVSGNEVATEEFLAAYIAGVNYVNAALANKDSDEYQKLVDIATKKTSGLTADEIKAALENITYLYADDATGSLTNLKSDVATMATSLKDLGSITKTISNTSEFADTFVQDKYVKAAIAGVTEKVEKKVTVAVISGDIHQIAIHVADSLGFFKDNNITVEFSLATNGNGVATSLQNGDSDFGLLGAPPATIITANTPLIEGTKYNENAFVIISRVNTEGSGIYINSDLITRDSNGVPMRNGVTFYEVSGEKYNVTSANAKAWGGLVLATPGISSIQHVQIAEIAHNLGLSFKMYTAGEKLSSDCIYYVTGIANYSMVQSNTVIDGGILWEPQFQKIIQSS